MKKVCIISFDQEGRYLQKLLSVKYDIPYIIERDCSLWGVRSENAEIISFSKAYKKYQEHEIEAFIIPCMRGINIKNMIYDRLIRNDVKSDDILYAPLRIFKDTELSEEEKLDLICRFKDRNELDFVAIHITDNCNLNCANCSVFSSIIRKPSFPDRYLTKKGILALKKYFDQIQVIRLLGGEPLLNPEWLSYCRFLRKLYPFSDIEVVSNGLLISSLSGEDLMTMKELNITFDISYYPVIGEKIDDIHRLLKKYAICHYITEENEFFSQLYDFQNPRDMSRNYLVCRQKFMCTNMRENFLYTCHAAVAGERAKKYLAEFPTGAEGPGKGKVDLLEENLSAKEIIGQLSKPFYMCNFCNQDLTPWRILDKDENSVNDWSLK